MSDPFIAEVKIFAGNFAPRSWAFCNGQLLPISQNTALFSLVGTTFGGDGRTTLGLPDLQGRAPMHPGNGPGLTGRRLGEKVGRESETLTAQQLPSHSHTLNAASNATQAGPGSGVSVGTAPMYNAGGTSQPMAAAAIGSAGAATVQPHNNMQPYLALNFVIALQGVYPSRN
ncbi:MAG: phage tail protein [Gammaproteobacteria bacterium]|nr:phage tail protein [Gammaproteobacteria bacterium]